MIRLAERDDLTDHREQREHEAAKKEQSIARLVTAIEAGGGAALAQRVRELVDRSRPPRTARGSRSRQIRGSPPVHGRGDAAPCSHHGCTEGTEHFGPEDTFEADYGSPLEPVWGKRLGDPGGIRTHDLHLERVACWAPAPQGRCGPRQSNTRPRQAAFFRGGACESAGPSRPVARRPRTGGPSAASNSRNTKALAPASSTRATTCRIHTFLALRPPLYTGQVPGQVRSFAMFSPGVQAGVARLPRGPPGPPPGRGLASATTMVLPPRA